MFFLKDFSDEMEQILVQLYFKNKMSGKHGEHIVFWYKISDQSFYGFKIFLTVLGFSIFMSYMCTMFQSKNWND